MRFPTAQLFSFFLLLGMPAPLAMARTTHVRSTHPAYAFVQTPAGTQAPAPAAASPAIVPAAKAPPAQASPDLPPMAPTALRPGEPTNAFPPLPGPLPASVTNRRLAPAAIGNAPIGATAATAGPPATTQKRRSALPPGPLTGTPLGIAAPPGELRVSGLGSSSAPWTIVLLLTALTLIPSLLICVTPFARLLVVFHFLRQALGLQTTPSNQTLIGLTMILTFFIMEPVGKQIYTRSLEPLQRGEITAFEAISRGQDPLRNFMVHYVREKDAALFLEIAKEPRPRDIHDLSMRVLLPAYIVSELKAGFQIGAVLFLPFLVVDMVVASITTSVGMMQLPPVVISTPLKLLLFLMVDGWHLLISALMRSFQ